MACFLKSLWNGKQISVHVWKVKKDQIKSRDVFLPIVSFNGWWPSPFQRPLKFSKVFAQTMLKDDTLESNPYFQLTSSLHKSPNPFSLETKHFSELFLDEKSKALLILASYVFRVINPVLKRVDLGWIQKTPDILSWRPPEVALHHCLLSTHVSKCDFHHHQACQITWFLFSLWAFLEGSNCNLAPTQNSMPQHRQFNKATVWG